jgi:hypothetical protein
MVIKRKAAVKRHAKSFDLTTERVTSMSTTLTDAISGKVASRLPV